jgi:hypothetical protein
MPAIAEPQDVAGGAQGARRHLCPREQVGQQEEENAIPQQLRQAHEERPEWVAPRRERSLLSLVLPWPRRAAQARWLKPPLRPSCPSLAVPIAPAPWRRGHHHSATPLLELIHVKRTIYEHSTGLISRDPEAFFLQ